MGCRLPPRRKNAQRDNTPHGNRPCWCRACDVAEARGMKWNGVGIHPGITVLRMNYCGHCGNLRCPCASNHNHACTKSNLPGQPGSDYK